MTQRRLGVMHSLGRPNFRLGRVVLGQGRRGSAAVGRGMVVLGLDRLDLGAVGQEEGFLARKGSVMVKIRLHKGFQPTMVLGNENFKLDL